MKTVTAISADGRRKMRVPVVAQKGPFSVAHPVDLRNGLRKVFKKLWNVYHTKTGCAFTPSFSKKAAAVKAMYMVAEIEGDWDRPAHQLNQDIQLRTKAHEAIARMKVECGDWIRIT